MRRFILLALAGTLNLALAAGATPPPAQKGPASVDFTPRPLQLKGDGYPSEALSILEGKQTVLLFPPSNWDLANGNASGIGFTNKKLASARFDLRTSTWSVPDKPDDKWLRDFGAAVLKGVPPGALKSGIQKAPAPAAGYGQGQAYEVTVDYVYLGTPFTRSVCLIVPRSGLVLELVTTSTTADFRTVHLAAQGLYQSWQILPAKYLKSQIVAR